MSENQNMMIVDIARRVCGDYDWERYTKEAKEKKTEIIKNVIQAIINDYSTVIRHYEIGDAYAVDEEDLIKIEKKWLEGSTVPLTAIDPWEKNGKYEIGKQSPNEVKHD